MPCIPDYRELREMHAESGVRAWRGTIEALIPSYRRFLPVFEALLADHPELAQSDDAQSCLAFMRRMAVWEAPPDSRDVDAMEAEAARLKDLAEVAESWLCDAGTIAWNATKSGSARSAELQAMLDRHQVHREEDRRARLEQLRSELRSVESNRDLSEDVRLLVASRARERIAELEALSVDAICSNRFVF